MRLVLLALVACGGERTLEAEIATGEVASWKLDEDAWRRLTVEPYRDLYREYAEAYDAVAPELARRARTGTIVTRKHFADDPELTTGEVIIRWALPTLAPSEVATAGGAPLDAVFVRDGTHWRAIAGLERVLRARISALEPYCAELLDAPSKQCRELAWEMAEGALRNQRARFGRACSLAAAHCGKPAP